MQNELDDTLRRFERTQSEQKTLSALSRQQAKELIVVRKRLDELLASRWRKLGQRIGVAMVLPWEQERANGQKG
jgi:ribosomal protein S21